MPGPAQLVPLMGHDPEDEAVVFGSGLQAARRP